VTAIFDEAGISYPTTNESGDKDEHAGRTREWQPSVSTTPSSLVIPLRNTSRNSSVGIALKIPITSWKRSCSSRRDLPTPSFFTFRNK
jgi:hypothetical protein